MSAWPRALARLTRTLHIYLSMLGMVVVLFFAVTGITLNHADAFGVGHDTAPASHTLEGRITVGRRDGALDRLSIAEQLRAQFAIAGAVTSFEVDEPECRVVFKRPGSTADASVDLDTGHVTVVVESAGWVSVINDLHMGRAAGPWWSLAIDAAAVLMIVASLTGGLLLFTLPSRRAVGLVVGVVGGLAFGAVYYWLVP